MADEVKAIEQNPATTNELSLQIADLVRKSDNVVLEFKLNGNNYPLWVRLMKVAIGSRGKTSHITGNPPPPATIDTTYQQWEENDLTVFSWLIQNMENKLVANFAQHQSAKAVWDSLAITYDTESDPLQIYDQEIKANKVNQGDLSLEDYWNNLQSIWLNIDQRQPNPLGCCEQGIRKYQKLISERRLFQFLSGLDVKYDNIRRDILKETPTPSTESAFAKVRREATRQQILSPAANPSDEGSIGSGLTSRHQPINRPESSHKPPTQKGNKHNRYGIPRKEDRSKLFCSHCGMKGHMKETCFQIVGYPDWWTDKHRIPQAKGRAAIGVDGGNNLETSGRAMIAGETRREDERASTRGKADAADQGREMEGFSTTLHIDPSSSKGYPNWEDHWAWH